ncbi:MAG: hypothetical protein JEZ10_02680 [Verrucomicrobia bacterium]|nr:hypothetical protein [Verrucomicrobiota bacterium]
MEKALPADSELLKEQNPEIRWYQAIKKHSGENLHIQYGFETDSKSGEHLGTIYTGYIDRIADVSANLCLWLETNYPVKDTRSFWSKFYETHGREIVVGVIVGILLMIAALLFGLPS